MNIILQIDMMSKKEKRKDGFGFDIFLDWIMVGKKKKKGNKKHNITIKFLKKHNITYLKK